MIRNYLQKIGVQYQQRYAIATHTHWETPTKQLQQLFAFATGMFALALLLFSINGYHTAFMPLNNLTPHIPPFILHNLTTFGDGALLLVLILVFAPSNVRFHWVTLITALLGAIVSNVLKDYFDASRPPGVIAQDIINIVGKSYSHRSFPSGHTLTAFLLASAGYCFCKHWSTKALLLLLAAGVGLSRILVGVHWPIDTLVGGALGILCGIASVLIAIKWQKGLTPKSHGFILVLFLLAAIQLFIQKKDYPQANFLMYVAAILAVLRFIKIYLVPNKTYRNELATENRGWYKLQQFFANPSATFFTFLAVVTVYRIAVILQPHLTLFYDEIYYYHWSLYPDLGYYSKPPMVAWVIALTTQLLGPSTLGLKLGAPLLYAGSAICVNRIGFQITKNVYSAALAGIIFITIPLVGFNSEFITTDAPLFFFWSLSLYLFFVALEKNRWQVWGLLGIATGLGMLSKYTMGALPLALFLFLIIRPKYRVLLAQPGPWLAAIVAGFVFSLNIYWNIQHDWVSAKHTQEISQTTGDLFHFGSLVEFLATQCLIFGPVWSYLLLSKSKWLINEVKTQTQQADAILCLALSTGTILLAISAQAFLARAFANWAGPWVIGASLLLAITFSNINRRWLVRGILVNFFLLSVFYHWPYIANSLSIPLSKKTDFYSRILGWEQLGNQLAPVLANNTNAILASDSRDLLAYMGFYAQRGTLNFARFQPNPNNIRDWYDLTFNLREHTGQHNQTFIYISKNKIEQKNAERFESIEQLSHLTVNVYDGVERHIFVYRATGFKGYGETNDSE